MEFSDEEDVKRAIALSLQDTNGQEVFVIDCDLDQTSPKAPKPLGFLGIDRKKMEQERLARKRKRSVSPPALTKTSKMLPFNVMQPPKQNLQTSPANAARDSKNSSSDGRDLHFQGIVKKTWAFGHERRGDDIKLEEVLQKEDLNLAVLSSFQWNIEWLLAKINTKTQITLVMQAKDEATRQQYKQETASMSSRLRLCFPSMEGQVNCMHSKLMLLSHPTYLRIVVPTANLVPYDWGESGDMENMIFLIDLPRLPLDTPSQPLTPFGAELVYFLEAMGLEQSIVDSISGFDFATTTDLAFVHTIGGAHTGDKSWRRTGYCGFGRAVRELGLATSGSLEVDFITSSVGSLNVDFLAMLYLATQGDDGTTEYAWRNPDTGKGKSKRSAGELADIETKQQRIKEEIRQNFHIYFPTNSTVKASTAGYAGTICFQSKWYNSPTFPSYALRDCKSARTRLLMHNKIIYVRRKSNAPHTDVNAEAWAYIGSANCSESAWGKLVKDRSTKTPKLNCRNWECGVIVSVRKYGKNAGIQGGLACFDGVVPVPMQYPGQPYGAQDPWYFAEQ